MIIIDFHFKLDKHIVAIEKIYKSIVVNLDKISYLKNIWKYCFANEANNKESDMTRPPITAVRRVDFLRQRDTRKGDSRYDIARFVAPIQAAIER